MPRERRPCEQNTEDLYGPMQTTPINDQPIIFSGRPYCLRCSSPLVKDWAGDISCFSCGWRPRVFVPCEEDLHPPLGRTGKPIKKHPERRYQFAS